MRENKLDVVVVVVVVVVTTPEYKPVITIKGIKANPTNHVVSLAMLIHCSGYIQLQMPISLSKFVTIIIGMLKVHAKFQQHGIIS